MGTGKQEKAMRKDEAVEFFGGPKALALAIGVTPAAVTNWGDMVPTGRRKSVRMAMKERAEQLEAEAKALRKAAQED